MAKQPDRRPAVAGEQFYITNERHLRAFGVSSSTEPVTVEPKGEGNEGQWFCISCCQALMNNMDKDTHCAGRAAKKSALVKKATAASARHVLAWRSTVSGNVEAP